MKKIKLSFSKKTKKRLPKKSKPPPKTLACDICLIVYGSMLLHTERQNIIAQPDEAFLQLTPTELAEAARRLLPQSDKRHRIALGLPGGEFVATPLKLPSIASQNLKSAVMLQLPTLLPGITEPLLLAVQAEPQGEQTCALWLPTQRAEELFQAFDKVGLFLTCIVPRPLIALPTKTTICRIVDEDEEAISGFEWSEGVIRQWLHLVKTDCEADVFQQQWQHILSTWRDDVESVWKTALDDWKNIPMPSPWAWQYAFVPPATQLHLATIQRQKQRRRLKLAAVVLLGALLAGIGWVIFYQETLKAQLAVLRQTTFEVRQLQAETVQIHESINPIHEFPQQQVTEILIALNQLVPKNSWITGFHIEAGQVKIEGYSPNAAELIQVLSAEPRFTGVGFIQPVRTEAGKPESKFGIGFKLKDINFKDYWLEYFPVEQ